MKRKRGVGEGGRGRGRGVKISEGEKRRERRQGGWKRESVPEYRRDSGVEGGGAGTGVGAARLAHSSERYPGTGVVITGDVV